MSSIISGVGSRSAGAWGVDLQPQAGGTALPESTSLRLPEGRLAAPSKFFKQGGVCSRVRSANASLTTSVQNNKLYATFCALMRQRNKQENLNSFCDIEWMSHKVKNSKK